MKVLFKVLKTGSGNDVYFKNLSDALCKAGIKSEVLYYHKIFQYIPFLLKYLNNKTDADIIHTNVDYGWAFKEKDKPLFVTLHHNVLDKEFQRYTSLLQKFYYNFILKPNIIKSLKTANKIIAVSNYTKNSFIDEYGPFNIQIIYNFINTDKFKPYPYISKDKRFKLLFVGNLIKRKGTDLLPQIMSRLGPEYVLYYTSGLRTDIPKDFSLPNMIALGKLSEAELIEEYNKCDALLFPTRLEGFGYCVAEAMSCGKPIISTNCSSIPEIVENDLNGYLCGVDNIDELVEKTRKIRNIHKGNSFLKNNRNRIINNFSINSLLKQYEKLYQK